MFLLRSLEVSLTTMFSTCSFLILPLDSVQICSYGQSMSEAPGFSSQLGGVIFLYSLHHSLVVVFCSTIQKLQVGFIYSFQKSPFCPCFLPMMKCGPVQLVCNTSASLCLLNGQAKMKSFSWLHSLFPTKKKSLALPSVFQFYLIFYIYIYWQHPVWENWMQFIQFFWGFFW